MLYTFPVAWWPDGLPGNDYTGLPELSVVYATESLKNRSFAAGLHAETDQGKEP